MQNGFNEFAIEQLEILAAAGIRFVIEDGKITKGLLEKEK